MISVGEVGNGDIRIGDRTPRVDETITSRLPEYVLRAGDVVFGRKGAVDRSAWLRPHEDGYFLGSDGIRVRFGREVSSRFMAYQFRLEPVRQWLVQHSAGTTMASMNQKILERLPVQVPRLAQQRAIAEVLGALDDKIVANDRFMATMLDLAIVRFGRFSRIHPGESMTLGALAGRGALEFSDGYRTKRSEHGTPGLRILRAGDVRGFRIFPTGPDHVSSSHRARIGSKASRGGDILLTTKGTVGRVAVVPAHMEEVAYSPQICYFRVIEENLVDFGYLSAWFNSRSLSDQLLVVMHKSDMAPYVNLQDIRALRVALPEIAAQRTEGRFHRSMIRSFQAMCNENDLLGRTRDELLALLMSGRIRVRDAEKVVEEVV